MQQSTMKNRGQRGAFTTVPRIARRFGWLTRIFGDSHFHPMNNSGLISPIIILDHRPIYYTTKFEHVCDIFATNTTTHPSLCILNYDTIFRERVFLVGVLISPSISFLLPCFDFVLLLRLGIFSGIFLEQRAVPPSQCDSSTS